MTDQLKQELELGLTGLGLSPAPQAVERLCLYCDRLLEKNQVMNLTAITDPGEVVRLHFLDSAALLACFNLTGKKVIDVGTGAGFPGLVLKILDPTMDLTLLDTLGKRMDWLRELSGELGLTSGITFIKGRAEEVSHQKDHRDQYDAAVSRALASLPVLAELCMPYVKPGGLFLAMKGSKAQEELEAASGILARLGGTAPRLTDYQVPGTEITHRIAAINKEKPTPKGYPRKWTKIKEEKAKIF